MRWRVLTVTLGVLAVVGLAAWLLAPPPTSGAGWRLDVGASWPAPDSRDLAATVVPYATSDAGEVGLGVTVYSSSSCAPRLRDVRIGSRAVSVEIGRGPMFVGSCTADAAPHAFGILAQRGELPSIPFDVVVTQGERSDRVGVTALP
jgi:hypothetical protein